jgi:hypothetical protein
MLAEPAVVIDYPSQSEGVAPPLAGRLSREPLIFALHGMVCSSFESRHLLKKGNNSCVLK